MNHGGTEDTEDTEAACATDAECDASSAQEARSAVADDMREGYLATQDEREALNEDWSVVDLEGWPD